MKSWHVSTACVGEGEKSNIKEQKQKKQDKDEAGSSAQSSWLCLSKCDLLLARHHLRSAKYRHHDMSGTYSNVGIIITHCHMTGIKHGVNKPSEVEDPNI